LSQTRPGGTGGTYEPWGDGDVPRITPPALFARRSPMPVASHTEPLSAYMSDVHRTDLLDRDQEAALAARWCAERDQAAAEELVRRNLRFVVKVAMGYRKYGVPVTDLIQEGNLGLMHAVEKFDPSRGTRLISYAVWWIKAYIQAYIIRS
jgi:RNA polymerase sigma-32 factor